MKSIIQRFSYCFFGILFSGAVAACENNAKLIISTYPETISVGDSLYVAIECINPSQEFFVLSYPIWTDFFGFNQFTFNVTINGEIYRGAFESSRGTRPQTGSAWLVVSPSTKKTIFVSEIQLPPLDDLHHPFWKKWCELLDQKIEGKVLTLDIEMLGLIPAGYGSDGYHTPKNDPVPQRMSVDVKIQARPKMEMNLLNSWHDSTLLKGLFPIIQQREEVHNHTDNYRDNNIRKVPYGMLDVGETETNKIVVQGERYSPWRFIRLGNRYPSDPNAPETWQGWKQLEESLMPSTMRDEIRLTRILIQYCDTESSTVLKELKDWFDGMNEIQRTVMAKALRDKTMNLLRTEVQIRREKIFPQFRAVYKTIREYDVVHIPKGDDGRLRDLGLIE